MALKAQLESSSKELNQTMEQMEQSRKDVESAVEGWPGEGLSNVFWGLHGFGFPHSFFFGTGGFYDGMCHPQIQQMFL